MTEYGDLISAFSKNTGKYGPEKSPHLDVFRAAKTIKVFSFIIRLQKILSDVFIINLFTLSKFSTIISAFITAQKIKFSIKDFLGKCDQIGKKLQIWPHLRKQSLTENFIFSPDFGGLLSFQNSLRTSQKHFFFFKQKKYAIPKDVELVPIPHEFF